MDLIDGEEIQRLFFDAKKKKQPAIQSLALEALELGVGSDAWVRCERILREEGPIRSARYARAREYHRQYYLDRRQKKSAA